MDQLEKYEYEEIRLPDYTRDLINLLKLKATPVAMKFFSDKREMEAVEKIRIPRKGELLTACQLVAQSTRLNYTVGFTNQHMPTLQCSGMLGFIDGQHFRDSDHLEGKWYATREDALRHQRAAFLPRERYEAVAVSPMVLGRLREPDVCLVYGTPQQILFMCCGLQYEGYESMTATFLGESSCTDSWIRALVTGKPCFTIPCYGERRFGGVLEDELLMAFPPQYIVKMIEGIRALSKNGMRYPASQYGIQNDVAAGMGSFYDLNALRREP
ncbi:DUF169 domain-containing protein [Clostridium sp. AM58-1XD]|uniref:DUF169 domain-containing protein n=1 Tax=Clostridium sp. AM58-1XD TaxID=2292307 RepID=UPI000E4B7221|nr:DUF169 domain-containing protein [Clostridium sp. AM58-1XD]RGY97633.1 hypothetical protein DXA13_14060 [Clostridium sp. AM58-1XD]